MAKKKTHEEFLEQIVNKNIEILGQYQTRSTKIRVKCKVCGYEWEANPYTIIPPRNYGCFKCASNKKIKTNDMFLLELYEKFKDEYIPQEEYVGVKVKMSIKHSKCGNIFVATPNSLLNGFGCKDCGYKIVSEKTKSSLIEFQLKVDIKYPESFLICGDYINSRTKIKIKCLKCKKTFKASPADFLTRGSCFYCTRSKGENRICDFLNKINLKFKQQYRFSDCKNKNPLPFDFAIFNEDKIFLCEYDGEGHYMSIPFNNMSDEKARQQLDYINGNDKIKNDYCKNNNIKLIRIPYWEFDNIEEILKKEILI